MKRSAEIQQQIDWLNTMGFDYVLDTHAAGYKVCANKGSRDVSPRLRAGEMMLWLDTFRTAISEIASRDEKRKKERERSVRESDEPYYAFDPKHWAE